MSRFESGRLVLRSWRGDDLDDLHKILSDEEVASLAGFSARENLEDSLEILKKFVDEPLNSLWAIELKEINKVIGWVELHKPIEEANKKSKEIGFVLAKCFWGQGLMAEAIKMVISYAFKEEDVECIKCSHFEYNTQSEKLIKKCGFKLEREVKGKKHYYLSYRE